MLLTKKKLFKRALFLFLFFSLYISPAQNAVVKKILYNSPFTVEKAIKEHVTLLKDTDGKKFLIKTYSDCFIGKQEAIREVMGYKIGKNIVNTNHVQIFKHTPPTTIHSYIEGVHDKRIYIAAGIYNYEIFNCIVQKDSSLAKIVAFNAYINNKDCHSKNLIKNQTTNQFSVIDFGRAFNGEGIYTTNYTESCCCFFQRTNKQKLSPEEMITIKCLSETLETLIEQYPPLTIFNKWMKIAQDINCTYNEDAKIRLKYNLDNNFKSSEKLLKILKNLL